MSESSGKFSAKIPFSANAFAAEGTVEQRGQISSGGLSFLTSSSESVFSLYFRVGQICRLELAVRAKCVGGTSVLRAALDTHVCRISVINSEFSDLNLFTVDLGETAGYVRLDISGEEKNGATFGQVSHLLVTSDQPLNHLAFVPDGFGDRFGRRGPSIHLKFKQPRNVGLEWFYSEILVPEGKDTVGSFYMTNGFNAGYCGLQVNSSTERRVLFSIWSTVKTDDPKSIPSSHQVKLLKCGGQNGICISQFGNEGSGMQSYDKVLWETGRKHKFLTRIQPDGLDSAIFTCFYGLVDSPDWSFLASFLRPFSPEKSHLGSYSFLENFDPKMGNHSRMGAYSNQWARDFTGQWHSLTEAKVTVDQTGDKGYRLDFFAESQPDMGFLLRNCGFFNDTVPAGTVLSRKPVGNPPQINFESLEEMMRV